MAQVLCVGERAWFVTQEEFLTLYRCAIVRRVTGDR